MRPILIQADIFFCRIYPLFSHKTPSTPHKSFLPFVLEVCDFVDSKDFCIDPVEADQEYECKTKSLGILNPGKWKKIQSHGDWRVKFKILNWSLGKLAENTKQQFLS